MTTQLLARIRIVGIATTAVLVASLSSAHAESPVNPCYQDAHVHPRQGGVPANAPALVFSPGRLAQDASVSAYELEWRAPDDSVVPYTLAPDPESSEYLVIPSQPLAMGTHRLRYHRLCTYTNPTGYDETRVSLTTAAALPTTIGTASLRSPFAEISGVATCMPVKVNAVVDVTMSPELAAYQELARYRVTYRQQPLQMDGYFQNDPPGVIDYGNLQHSETVLYLPVHDTCALGQARMQGRLEITAHVAGASSDPVPLVIDLDAECPFFKYGPPPLCSELDAGVGPIAADAADMADGRVIDAAVPDAPNAVDRPIVGGDAPRGIDATSVVLADAPSMSDLPAVRGVDSGLDARDVAVASHDARVAAPDGSVPATPSVDNGCGCALSRGQRGSGASLALLLGLALLGLHRRRRRRASPGPMLVGRRGEKRSRRLWSSMCLRTPSIQPKRRGSSSATS